MTPLFSYSSFIKNIPSHYLWTLELWLLQYSRMKITIEPVGIKDLKHKIYDTLGKP